MKGAMFLLLLSGCVMPPQNAAYNPYQQQQNQRFYNALLQAGQPSPVPISNAQALGQAMNAANGMPQNQFAPQPMPVRCFTSRFGAGYSTSCY